MRSKKPAITIEEYLIQKDKKALYNEKYKKSISDARGEDPTKEIDDFDLNVGKYSLRARIKNSTWLKSGRPASQSIKWLYQTVFKDPKTYKYNKSLLAQGKLFTFEYKNPKYKGTKQLPWFDKYPMVLSLGPVTTKQGIRNLGFNLHLVPPKIRIIILCKIFDLYKRVYRYQVFYKKEGSVQIKYQYILKSLDRYGVDFCVRMYIPARQNQIVCFPYKDWSKAIFIPSRSYDSIKAPKLINLWKKHIKTKGFGTSANTNWQSNV